MVGHGVVALFPELDCYFEVIVGVIFLVNEVVGPKLGFEVIALEVVYSGGDVNG